MICCTYQIVAQNNPEKELNELTDVVLVKELRVLEKEIEKAFETKNIEQFITVYYKQLEILESIKGNEDTKYKIYKNKGDYFKRVKLYRESNKNYKLALHYWNKIDDTLIDLYISSGGFFANNLLADNYVKLAYLDSATVQYKKIIEYTQQKKIKFDPIEFEESLIKASAINNVGVHLLENLNQFDLALPYFKKADSVLKNSGDRVKQFLAGSVRDNIANVYVNNKQLNKAKELFKQNFKFYSPKKDKSIMPDHERWLRAGIQVAETDIKLGLIKEAEYMLATIDSLLFVHKDHYNESKNRLRQLKAKEQLYIVTRKYKKAYEIKNQEKALTDSLEHREQVKHNVWITTLKSLAIKNLKGNLETKYLKEEIQQQQKRLTLWITIIGLIMVLTLLVFIFITYKKRLILLRKNKYIAEQQIQLVDLKNDLLNKKVELKKRDLSDVAINASQNQEWIKKTLKQVESLKLTRGRARAKALNELETEIYNKTVFDENTKEFYEEIDKLSNSFYRALIKEFPELTKLEIKLCAMIRLGLDNNKIAMLQHIHQNSVHQSRYRLRKKLKLSKLQDLDRFLIEF